MTAADDDDAYWTEQSRKRDIAYQAHHHPERMKNNPNAEPVGHFTGRCKNCGSNDLWDDANHYGCNTCGAVLL